MATKRKKDRKKHRLGTKIVFFSVGSVLTKAILCLHSIIAVQAVIMAKDI